VTVLPVGAVSAALSSSSLAGLSGSASSSLAAGEGALGGPSARLNLSSANSATGRFAGSSALEGVAGSSPTALAGTTGVEGASGVEGVGGIEGGGYEGAGGVGRQGGFGEALTHAIASLEQTQQSSDGAAQALATGTASNPESAVVTVEDAQLAMQLASQVRTKAVEAVQQIFQTQV
jgi:flagellar hook-basal body complex protein FliE